MPGSFLKWMRAALGHPAVQAIGIVVLMAIAVPPAFWLLGQWVSFWFQ